MGGSELSDHVRRSDGRHGACFARLRSVLLSALVLVTLANCAPWEPPVVTEELRNQLGVVGVVSVDFAPDDEFSTALRGRVTGFTTGFATGGLSGLAYAAMGSAPFPPGFIIVGPIFGVTGAVSGGIAGWITAVPEDTAREIESQIIEILSTAPPQESLRRHVIEAAREEGLQHIFELVVQGPTSAEEYVDYRRLTEVGIDTVLEIGVVAVGLKGEGGGDPELALFLQARARLIRAASNTELYSDETIPYLIGRWKFTEWGADGARLMRESLERGYRELAYKIIDQIFLEVRWD